jgi:iron complex transport system ATP-binding protein
MNLEVEGLSFGYPGRVVGTGVDLTVSPGECVCLLGPNGCGKTTLFKTILGLRPALAGRIRVGGRDITDIPARDRARLMAYVPQHHRDPFPFNVVDFVIMGRTSHISALAVPAARDRRIAIESLDLVGIRHLGGELITELSGGQLQLVLIARALAQGTQLLILDEPTASLDFGNQAVVMQRVRELTGHGLALIMSTHAPDQAIRHGTRVALMRDGQIVTAGSPRSVITSENLSGTYGVPVAVVGSDGLTACIPLPVSREPSVFKAEDGTDPTKPLGEMIRGLGMTLLLGIGLLQGLITQTRPPQAASTAGPRRNYDPAAARAHLDRAYELRRTARKVHYPPGKPVPLGELDVTWDSDMRALVQTELAQARRADAGNFEILTALIQVDSEADQGEALLKLMRTVPDAAFTSELKPLLIAALPRLLETPGPEYAAEIAERWLGLMPDDLEVRHAVARAYLLGGRIDELLKILPKWKAAAPTDEEFPLREVQAHLLIGELDEARRLARHLPYRGPAAWLSDLLDAVAKDVPASCRLQRLLTTEKEREPGFAKVAEHIARSGPDSATQLNDLVADLVLYHRPVEAAVALAARRRIGSWGEAEQWLEAEIFKGIREFRRELAILAQLEPKVVKNRQLDFGIADYNFFFRKGRALFHAGNLDAADATFKRARELGKTDAEMYFHLGRLRLMQGRKSEAIDCFKKGTLWNPLDKHTQLAEKKLKALESGNASPD